MHFARELLDASERPITEIAFASGFARAPRDVRRGARSAEGIALQLRYRPPYDWDGMLGFLAARAIPGVECVSDGAYRRTIALGADGEVAGWLEVTPLPAEATLILRVSGPERAELLDVVERVRRIFDLRADPLAIAATLGALGARRPGLRVPGTWDPFELGVRAILGQQVSLAGASTLAGRIARAFGEQVAAPEGLTHSQHLKRFLERAHAVERERAARHGRREAADRLRARARVSPSDARSTFASASGLLEHERGRERGRASGDVL